MALSDRTQVTVLDLKLEATTAQLVMQMYVRIWNPLKGERLMRCRLLAMGLSTCCPMRSGQAGASDPKPGSGNARARAHLDIVDDLQQQDADGGLADQEPQAHRAARRGHAAGQRRGAQQPPRHPARDGRFLESALIRVHD